MSAPEAPTPAASGVIHDIGYRHYEGTRLRGASIERALYVDSLRGAFGLGRPLRSKVAPALILAAVCLPALIITMIGAIVPFAELPVNYGGYVNDVQVLISIFLATQAPVLLSRDLRHRVVTLYFSRPIRRSSYVRAKFEAMVTAVFILTATPIVILLLGALLAELPLGEQLPEFFRALGGAAAYALVLSGVALAIAAMTPRRGVGVAAIIAVLLVLAGVQAMVREIALEVGQRGLATYSVFISPFSIVDAMAGHLLRAESAIPANTSDTTAVLIFSVGWLVPVAISAGVLLLRYRTVSVT